MLLQQHSATSVLYVLYVYSLVLQLKLVIKVAWSGYLYTISVTHNFITYTAFWWW